jgi:catechol 2,3-dioxygenase
MTVHEDVGIPAPGFRLPPDTRVGRVRLQVADLDRSLRFYRDLIGFAVHGEDGGVARLGAHDSAAVLLELVEKPGVRPVPRRGLLGLYHFALLLPERAALGRFLRQQRALGTPFGSADHAFSEALYLVDPDGLTLEVYADRPRETWQVRNRQYAAVSDPLDHAALIAAADAADGDATWAGVPRGSVIGHVHLYIGDIAEATSFYHEALGFDRVIWDFPGALFVSAGGYHHHVGLNTWAVGAPIATADDARMLHWELVLPGARAVQEAAASLEKHGYTVVRDVAGRDDVAATDPWNITLRLITG